MNPVYCHIFYVYKHACMITFVVMSVSTVTPAYAYLYIDYTVIPIYFPPRFTIIATPVYFPQPICLFPPILTIIVIPVHFPLSL